MRQIRKNEELTAPYLNAGHRVYAIGAQNGSFPAGGWHVPNEMYGIWMPPFKLADGFLVRVNGIGADAEAYEQLPFGSRFCGEKLGCICGERIQFPAREDKAFCVEFTLGNLSTQDEEFTIELCLQSGLTPAWLSERHGIEAGPVKAEWLAQQNTLLFENERNGYFAAVRCDEGLFTEASAAVGHVPSGEAPFGDALPAPGKNTACAVLRGKVRLAAGAMKRFRFVIVGDERLKEHALRTAEKAHRTFDALLAEQILAVEAIDQRAALYFPGKPVLEEMYAWTKYINEWIVRKVDGIGSGVVAGYQDFPWWFGNDTNYIVPALLMEGSYEAVRETLRTIRKYSEKVNGNGRVVHEISTSGEVYYEGMTTETPQFADTVLMYYNWSGDVEFVREMYDFCRQGAEWLETVSEDGLPRGYGIWEVAGMNCFCCDSALLVIRGYEALYKMAEILGYEEDRLCYRARFDALLARFEREFYMPEYGFYGDMVATKEEITERAESWKKSIGRFPMTEDDIAEAEERIAHETNAERADREKRVAHMEELLAEAAKMAPGSRRAFFVFGSGQSTIPIEFGYLTGDRARAIYDAQEKAMAHAVIHTDDPMPFGNGRRILALGRMKRLGEILKNIEFVASGFSKVMPGATNEIYPGKGCFVQAWNSLATMWPYADSLFGIRPDAGRKTVLLDPCLDGTVDGLELRNLVLGGECFDLSWKDGVLTVTRPSEAWSVSLADSEESAGIGLVIKNRS